VSSGEWEQIRSTPVSGVTKRRCCYCAVAGWCPDAAATPVSNDRSTSIPRNAVSGNETPLTGVDLTVQRRWCFANSRRRLKFGGGNRDVIGCHVTQDIARVASDRPISPCSRDVIAQRRPLLSPAASTPTGRSRTTISAGYKGAQAFVKG